MKTKFSTIAKTVILLTGLSGSAFGQDQVSYKNIWDNPYTWKSLIVNVHWFDYATPIDIIVGVGADYQLNKRVLFSMDYSKEWMGILVNDKGLKRSSGYFEMGGVFCFASWMRNGKAVFSWTDSDPNMGPTIRNTVKVPAKVLKQYCVRGGLLSYSKILDEGEVIGSTNGFYGGFSILTTRNRSIDISGIRSDLTDCERRKNFYVDVLFAPSVSYTPNADYNSDAFVNGLPWKPFPSGGEKDFAKYESTDWDTVFGINHIGYRLGVMWTGASIWGLYAKYGYELGMKPGPKNNYYLLFRFALSLGFEVPSLSNMEEKNKSGLEGE